MTSDNSADDGVNWGRLKGPALGLALVVFLVGGFWFWRPWWHWLYYSLLYQNPGAVQWFVVGGLTSTAAVVWTILRAGGSSSNSSNSSRRSSTHDGVLKTTWKVTANAMGTKTAAIFIFGLVVMTVGSVVGGAFIGDVYTNEHMADQVESEVTGIEELPEANASAARILPYQVSHEYAENSLQYPRHRLQGGDIAYRNGTPHWSYALAPDGFFNSLFAAQQKGGVYVNMSTSGSDVTIEENEFKYGQGAYLWRNYKWQLLKEDYDVEYQDPVMLVHEDEQYMAVPYITHDREFRATPVPQVYSVPEFGGVKIVHTDGTIEDVSPDEVDDNAILHGQRVYPYDLAKFKVNSMQYKNGVLNKWFYHEDQLQLAPAPGEGNDQPFTVTTEDGIKYFVAAEPWGDASGIYQVWVIDARSGEMERLQVDVESAMLGPNRAVNYVRQENPMVDWDRMDPVEPIPAVRDGTLYWQVKIVPGDSAGVSYTAFVNADTSEVTTVREDGAVRSFLAGGDVDDQLDTGNSTDDGKTGNQGDADTIVITIQHEDGSTERIEVTEGSTITIGSSDGNATDEE